MNARFRFCLIALSTLLAVALTLSLGRWQLRRAAQKEAFQAHIDAGTALPKLTSQALTVQGDKLLQLHRLVLLRGRWLAQRTVYLENRQMNNRQGFYVVTPLQLEGSANVVLVQRGWVARNFIDRTLLPKIDTPTASVEIEGRIAPPPSKLFEFEASETGPIRQNLDMKRFASEVGAPLLGVSVQQLGPASEGLQRDWPPVEAGVEKHYGYAFQWFALSALLAILYVWFQIVSPLHIKKR
ncbi:MAG: SURF1 family protein [Comamonadaceae bacterium]